MKTMIFGCSSGPPLFDLWLPAFRRDFLLSSSPPPAPAPPSNGHRWRTNLSSILLLFFTLFIGQFSVSDSSKSGDSSKHYGGLDQFFDVLHLDPPVSKQQCRLLTWKIGREICERADWRREPRTRTMRSVNLPFCSDFPVASAVNLDNCDIELLSERDCRKCLRTLEQLDEQAYKMYCHFKDILARFDCEQAFSRHWNCSHCQEAYKSWLCANHIPYYHHTARHSASHPSTPRSQRVPPCRSYCSLVHNRCPYLLPDRNTQYAGESSFLCADDPVDSACHAPCQPSQYSSLPITDHPSGICVIPHTSLSTKHVTSSPTTTTTQVTSSMTSSLWPCVYLLAISLIPHTLTGWT